MKITKRGFLKIAGIGLLGAGVKPAFKAIASPDGEAAVKETGFTTAKRLALVVDMRKCKSNEGCKDCITACHTEHNVPDFGNPKDEIKWIWTEKFKHAFPSAEHAFLNEEAERGDYLVLCNHCDNPPCVRVCPTKATWKRPLTKWRI